MNLIHKIIIILAILFAVCAYSQPKERTALPQDTVARIGISAITARDLLERLELMPFPRKDKPSQKDSAKVRALLGLIAEKVLANEAHRLNLAETPATRRMREGLEDLFIRDELFKREVVQKVKPSEEELYIGLRRFAVKYKVISFMMNSEADARMVVSQIRRNMGCDNVLHLSAVQEVDTIDITFGVLEPEVEDVIYSIDSSRVSRPFFGPQSGWVVFYIAEKRSNPASQKMDMASRRSHVEKIIRTHKQRVRGEEYTFQVLNSKHASADSVVFNMIADTITAFWKTDPLHFQRNGAYLLSSDMVDVLLDRFAFCADTILVRSDGMNLSLSQVLEMFRYENFSSPDLSGSTFKVRLNETIKGIAANRLLALEGRKQNYQNTTAVQQDLRRWTDHWAGGILYYHVQDTVTISDEDVIQYLISKKDMYGISYEVNVKEILCSNLHDVSLIVEQLNRGGRFDSLAYNFSKRTAWAKQGGESGFFPVKEHPEIGSRALDADTGKLVGPYKLPEGYSVFIVLGKRKIHESVVEYNTVKQSVRAPLLQEKQKQTMDRYIARLAHEQDVTINYDQLKKIEMKPVQMFTRRFIGFGGTMTAVPLLRFQWDWIKEFEQSVNIIP